MYNKKIELRNKYKEELYNLLSVIIKQPTFINKFKEEKNNFKLEEEEEILLETIEEIFKKEKTVNYIKIETYLKNKYPTNDFKEFISSLKNSYKENFTYEDKLSKTKDISKKLKLIETVNILKNDIEDKNFDKIIDNFNKNTHKIRNNNKIEDISSQLNKFKERILIAKENFGNNKLTGFQSYIEDLDKICLGFDEESLNIVAARPAMGKSAFILTIIANHIRMKTFKKFVLFSLEMPSDQLLARIAAILSGVLLTKIRSGNLNNIDLEKLENAIIEIENSGLIIEDKANITINDIWNKTVELKEENSLSAIFIDYLQLISNHGGITDRRLVVDEISRKLKLLAKETKTPVFALSQLNRELEKRQDKRPILSDIRESGAIEQDADRIIFIYRDSVYKKNESNNKKTNFESEFITEDISELIVAKNRNGPIGTIYSKYLEQITYFQNAEESEVTKEILKNIRKELEIDSDNLGIDLTEDNILEFEIKEDVKSQDVIIAKQENQEVDNQKVASKKSKKPTKEVIEKIQQKLIEEKNLEVENIF